MKLPVSEQWQVENDFRGNCLHLSAASISKQKHSCYEMTSVWPLSVRLPWSTSFPPAHTPNSKLLVRNWSKWQEYSACICLSVCLFDFLCFCQVVLLDCEVSQCSSCVSVSVVLSNPCHLFLCWEMSWRGGRVCPISNELRLWNV